jgi:hypothetical protein
MMSNPPFTADMLHRLIEEHLPERNRAIVWEEQGVIYAFKYGYDRWWLTEEGRARTDVPWEIREDDRVNRAIRDRALAADEERQAREQAEHKE